MGLFERAGKKFEEAKQSFLDGKVQFVCRACETPVTTAYEYCPHCGEAAVESAE